MAKQHDKQFKADRPNAVWCSDITYIWTIDGFVYLKAYRLVFEYIGAFIILDAFTVIVTS